MPKADPNELIVYSGPRWAWKKIWDTLRLGRKSRALDPDLRRELGDAIDAVEKWA